MPEYKQFDSVYLMVTNRCNLRCKYCYESIRKGDMDFEVAKQAIQWLSTQKQRKRESHITFFGGEPLLRPRFIIDFIKYGQEINKRPDKYSILTNGTVWNDDVEECLKYMKKNSSRSIVQISLDGYRESHNRFRVYEDGRGSYDDIIANVENFKKIYPDLIFRQTVVPENVENLYKDFKMMHELCGDRGNVSLTSIVEGDWNDTSIKIYREEMERILKDFKDLAKNTTFNLLHGTLQRMSNQDLKNSRGCAASKTLCCVDTKGDIYPCHRFASYQDFFDYKIGNVRDGVDYEGEIFKKVRSVFGFSDKCNKCRITNCNVCMATNVYVGRGLTMDPPSRYCDMGFSVNDMLEEYALYYVGNGKIKLDWGQLIKNDNGGGYFKMKDGENTKFEDKDDLTAQALVTIISMIKGMMVEINEIKKQINCKKEETCGCNECSTN